MFDPSKINSTYIDLAVADFCPEVEKRFRAAMAKQMCVRGDSWALGAILGLENR